MKLIEKFLQGCVNSSFIDGAERNSAGYKVHSGDTSLDIHINPFKDRAVIWNSAKPTELFLLKSDDLEPVLCRAIAQGISGLRNGEFRGRVYSNAVVVPVEATDKGLVFEDARNRRYIASDTGGDAVEPMLGLYNILYSTKGENKIMSMPCLFPEDSVDMTGSSGTYTSAAYGASANASGGSNPTSAVAASAHVAESSLYIKSSCIPRVGYGMVGERATSAASYDTVSRMDYALDRFMTEPPKAVKETRPASTINSIFSNAESLRLRLDGNYAFLDTVGYDSSVETHGTFRVNSDIRPLATLLGSRGISLASIKSGVELADQEVDSLQFFFRETRSLEPVKTSPLDFKVFSCVLSGVAMNKELEEFGLENNGAFKKMSILSFGKQAERDHTVYLKSSAPIGTADSNTGIGSPGTETPASIQSDAGGDMSMPSGDASSMVASSADEIAPEGGEETEGEEIVSNAEGERAVGEMTATSKPSVAEGPKV